MTYQPISTVVVHVIQTLDTDQPTVTALAVQKVLEEAFGTMFAVHDATHVIPTDCAGVEGCGIDTVETPHS